MTTLQTHIQGGMQAAATTPRSSRSLTVLHSIAGSWLEATQTWLYHQVRALPETVTSHIVCQKKANLDQFPLPNIHAESDDPTLGRIIDQALRKTHLRRHAGLLERTIRATGAEVLHSHFGYMGWENILLAKKHGLKHVVTFYGLDVNYLPSHGWADKYHELFAHVDRVLCEGPHMADCIVKLGCDAKKIRVHHLGVDLNRIEYRPLTWDGTEPLKFLIAASFREKKGIPHGIEALGRIGEDRPIEVTIIGDAGSSLESKELKASIMRLIDRCNLTSRVRMLGYQPHDELLREATKHHVFISPSLTAANGDTEGGAPVCLIEMMASGLTIISTRHCDIPEVVCPGSAGWLAAEGDVSGLVQCIHNMIAAREQWPTLRECSRTHVEDEFDAQEQGRRLGALYGNLVDENGT